MEFKEFKKVVTKQIEEMSKGDEKLFFTKATKDDLWETYLNSFPEGTDPIYKERSEHDCNCCKQFIRHIGSLVSIVNNKLVSIWDVEVDYPYNIVAKKLSELVKSKDINNVYLSVEKSAGTDSNKQLLEDGTVKTWNHFYSKIPTQCIHKGSDSVESKQGIYRASKDVFKRSMKELTIQAGETIQELIDQGSLYRGTEHTKSIKEFIKTKKQYDKIPEKKKDNWCWKNSIVSKISRIRNSALGTLLIDLSEGVDLDTAVRKFEKVMAPTNYKRPKAIFTKKMVEEAENKIIELGLQDSLSRKFAVLEDITVNNVLFVNRDAKKKMNGSIFDDLKENISEKPKKFNKVEEVSIDDFIENILPKTNSIELMVENKHQGNFMSLVSPEDRESPSILKWNNNFSWSYNGGIADSMKQHVKNAGGNVEGVLRFSIQWNDDKDNNNDFDAHCIEPSGNRIFFSQKNNFLTTGNLDVDIQSPGNKVAVENITWSNITKMEEGKYTFLVHNYTHRGGRKGFKAEIEYDGEIHSFEYNNELKQDEKVTVAEINFSKSKGIKFIKSLDSSVSSKEIWGLNTNKFTKASVVMHSPNYWDGQKGIGNKHYFFFLEGCKSESTPRGFYNEFLNDSLTKHKRVFEALGSKMKVEDSDEQLSGLGFSSTQRNEIIVKVNGSFTRTIKVKF